MSKPLVIAKEDDGTLLLYRQGSPRSAVRIEPDELGYVTTALVASMAVAMRQPKGELS